MGPLKTLFSGVRLLTVLSITAIVGGIVLQSEDIAETAKRVVDSPLQGWVRGQRILVSQADCSGQEWPKWPDCETIECVSGNYSCTKMKEGSSGGSSGGGGTGSCSGSPPTSTSWCDYSTSPPSWRESDWHGDSGGSWGGSGGSWQASPEVQAACRDRCNATGKYSSGDCQMYCEDGDFEGAGSSGGSWGGSGGSWQASPEVQAACRDRCNATGKYSSGDCQMYCEDGEFEGPGGTAGGTWGGSGGMGPGCPAPTFTDKPSCVKYCNEKGMGGCDWACDDFNPCGAGTGESGGAWGGSGGSGGGQDSCIRGCEDAESRKNTDPACKQTQSPRWCTDSLTQCKAACGGGVGGSGGVEGGWVPPPIDKSLAKAQCSRDPKTGLLSYMNATIKGWTVLPKYDCESAGLRPGEMQRPAASKCPQGNSWNDGCNTCTCDPKTGNTMCTQAYCPDGNFAGDVGNFGGFGDYMGDAAGGGGDPDKHMAAPPFEDKFQLEREKKDMLRNLNQRTREVKDMRRSLKDSRSENPAIASKIDAFEQGIQKTTGCFQSASSFDMMQDCHDQNNDLNDLTQDIWPALQAGNIKRDIEQSGREEKNMTREIDRLTREGVDASELKALLSDWQSARSNVQSLLNTDPEEAQYAMQDVWDAQNEFWQAMQGLQWEKQSVRMEKEGCRDFEREAKRAPKDVRPQLEGLADDCKDLVATTKADIKSGTLDPRDANDNLNWGMQDLWAQFQSIMEDQWGANECRDAERGLGDAERAVTQEAPQIIAEVRAENPAIADKMDSLLAKAKNILSAGQKDLESGSCDKAIAATDTLHRDISKRFDDLMRQAGIEPDFDDDRFDYDDIYDEFGFDDDEFDREDFARHLKDQDYDNGAISLAKRIAAEILKDYFKNQKDTGAPDLITAADDLGLNTLDVQNLLNTKNALLAQIESLRSEIQGLKDELVAIADQVKRFTFGRETAKEAEEFVKNELPHLTEEEAAARFAELQEAAGEELYADGVIPFEDTYLGEWYTTHAKHARELGLVEGTGVSGGTKLNPTGDTNIAEAITMVARLVGDVDEDATPASDIGTDLPDWAQPFAATLEDAGVDLDAIFDADANASDAITREEVALLIDAALNLPDADIDLSAFRDIDDASTDARDSIGNIVDAGIMGQGVTAFRPNVSINRAELVTVLNRAHKEFVGVDGGFRPRSGDEFDFDEGDFDEEEFSDRSQETEQITICHLPPGNLSNVRTMTIGASAWKAHESHGDTEGPCSEETTIQTSGRRFTGSRPSNRTR